MLANFKHLILMHVIVLIWGFTGILGKLIQLDHYQIVYFRILLSGISLFIYLLTARKQFIIRDKKQRFQVLTVGIIVTLHWLFFYKAIQVSTASVGVLCLSTTTLHISWLEPLIMKRKFSWIEFCLGLLVVIGIGFISDNIDASQIEGVLWGLLAAIFAASFSVFNLKFKRSGISSPSITLYEMLSGGIFLTIVLGFQGRINTDFFMMTWSDLGWLLFLSIICTSLAYILMIEVVNKIGAFAASLSINLEPVYSILLAIVILNENEVLNTQFYIGTIFIVLVIIANPILKKILSRSEKQRNLSV